MRPVTPSAKEFLLAGAHRYRCVLIPVWYPVITLYNSQKIWMHVYQPVGFLGWTRWKMGEKNVK